MERAITSDAVDVCCIKCGLDLSKANSIIYINGLPVCNWCLEELNKK